MPVNHPRSFLLLVLYALVLWMTMTPQAAPAAVTPLDLPAPPVQPLDAAPFGLNTHLATRYPDIETMHAAADRIVESGAGWAREDIHWWRIQPGPTTWNWEFTDQAMRELISRKINIVGVIGHPPGWVTGHTGDHPYDVSFYPPSPQEFAQFAQAVVQRYGRYVHYWEIWNEPDNPLFWKPTPDAHAYAALLKATAVAIRGVDPSAKILIGGLNPFDTTFLRTIAESGAWSSFDILAIHPYVDPNTPEAGNIGAAADGVRTLAARYGAKPIWATEVGWSSGRGDHDSVGVTSEQDQANYLVRSTLLLWRAGVERIFWYTLKDDPGNPYGLFALGSGRADYSLPKPAFIAFRTLSRQLGQAKFVGMRDLFTRTSVFDFDAFGGWRRGDQPYGSFTATREQARNGGAGQLNYNFPTSGNDYVVFVRDWPIPIPGQPYALGLWVYGDGSGHTLKVWLRDADGDILQYALGTVGTPGWHLLQAPIGGTVAEWNRISKGGNGRLDFPASLYALVLDDAPDSFTGSGTLYVDDLMAISGPEAYDMQLQRGDSALDVLWAPVGLRARLSIGEDSATVTSRDGDTRTATAESGVLRLNLGPSPIYVQHRP